MSRRFAGGGLLALAAMALGGCQSTSGPGEIRLTSADAALPVMERITHAAARCWSNEPAFKPYRLAPELDSYTGRPRLLVVPAQSPGSLPLAVIQAQGSPATVQAFGPLMNGAAGNRIKADVERWAGGNTSCGAAA
ncbi:MAG TPA: hypothetical protein VFJ18_09295 [Pararhizobium sp.]|jgi:hypothetical protein|nr:hypothetical protein [Pararhizobium sp.]